jgi:hypothetical protein
LGQHLGHYKVIVTDLDLKWHTPEKSIYGYKR